MGAGSGKPAVQAAPDYAGHSGAHTPQIERYRRNAESLRQQIRECLDAGFEPRMETRDRLFTLERAIAKAEGRQS